MCEKYYAFIMAIVFMQQPRVKTWEKNFAFNMAIVILQQPPMSSYFT